MQAHWQDPPPPGGSQLALPVFTPVVRALIIANAAVFALLFLLYMSGTPILPAVIDVFGISPDLWRDWAPLLPVWQLVTWGFLHDPTSLFHILFNMLSLFFFGTMVEGTVGGRRFLVFYGGALLAAGLVTVLVGLVAGETRPTIGASGATLAAVVAAAVLRPHARVVFFIFPMTLRTMALIFVAIDVFGALYAVKGVDSGVAHLAHLTGAAFGFLMIRRGWIWRDPVVAWTARRQRQEEQHDVEDESRLDEILARINREGIQSLSAREKSFLKRVSKRRR